MEQHDEIPAAHFLFPILVEPCVLDYLVEWLSPYFSFSLEQFLLFIGSLAKYKKRNLFQRTIYIIPPPPLCPFRDISFFLALLIRFSPYLMFNYTYCSVLLPETITVHAKKAKYRLCFVTQSVADRRNANLGSKSFEMRPSSNILEGSDLKII